MSDFLMAFYDTDRDAVIIQLQSGTEVAVMDIDEADSFADEVKAAARKESTGYEEFFAQHNGEDADPADLLEYLRPDGEPLDADSNPFIGSYGEDEPDAQTRADAEDALRLLAQDDAATVEHSQSSDPQGPCILTGEPGENDEDCTTHGHETP